MRSDSQRGRSIANDSSVQTLFMTINAMHPQLMEYISKQEEARGTRNIHSYFRNSLKMEYAEKWNIFLIMEKKNILCCVVVLFSRMLIICSCRWKFIIFLSS